MTPEELEATVRRWQERLRLRDWDVHVAVKRARDMDLDGRAAEVGCSPATRDAWITLRDPVDFSPDTVQGYDPELSIVHELIHIYTRPFELPRDGPKHIAEEWLIKAVSRALVALAREPETEATRAGEAVEKARQEVADADERAAALFKAAAAEQAERLRLEEEAVKQHKERVQMRQRIMDLEGRA